MQYNYYLHFLFLRKINHSYSAQCPHAELSGAYRTDPSAITASPFPPTPPGSAGAIIHLPFTVPLPLCSVLSLCCPTALGYGQWVRSLGWAASLGGEMGPHRWLVHSGWHPICSGFFPAGLDFPPTLFAHFLSLVFCFFFFDHFFLSPANFYSNMEGWGLSIGKAGEASRRSKSSGPSSPPSFPNQPCRAKGFQGQIQAAKEEEKCLPCQPVHHSGKRPLVPSPQNCYVRMKSGSCSFPCVILVQCPNAKIPSNGALSTPGFGPSGRVLGSITLHCSPLPWAAQDTVYAPFGKGFQPSHSHPKGAFPAIKL